MQMDPLLRCTVWSSKSVTSCTQEILWCDNRPPSCNSYKSYRKLRAWRCYLLLKLHIPTSLSLVHVIKWITKTDMAVMLSDFHRKEGTH